MDPKKIKIHYCFYFVSLLILLIGLSDIDSTLDINVHDTYFVISQFHVEIVLSLVYFIYGFGYWLVQERLKKRLVKTLTTLHSIFLIGSFLGYWIVIFYTKIVVANNNFPLFDDYQIINITLVICSIICLIALPIYLINLAIGVFRKSS